MQGNSLIENMLFYIQRIQTRFLMHWKCWDQPLPWPTVGQMWDTPREQGTTLKNPFIWCLVESESKQFSCPADEFNTYLMWDWQKSHPSSCSSYCHIHISLSIVERGIALTMKSQKQGRMLIPTHGRKLQSWNMSNKKSSQWWSLNKEFGLHPLEHLCGTNHWGCGNSRVCWDEIYG